MKRTDLLAIRARVLVICLWGKFMQCISVIQDVIQDVCFMRNQSFWCRLCSFFLFLFWTSDTSLMSIQVNTKTQTSCLKSSCSLNRLQCSRILCYSDATTVHTSLIHCVPDSLRVLLGLVSGSSARSSVREYHMHSTSGPSISIVVMRVSYAHDIRSRAFLCDAMQCDTIHTVNVRMRATSRCHSVLYNWFKSCSCLCAF